MYKYAYRAITHEYSPNCSTPNVLAKYSVVKNPNTFEANSPNARWLKLMKIPLRELSREFVIR
jgi:hypothetical protein